MNVKVDFIWIYVVALRITQRKQNFQDAKYKRKTRCEILRPKTGNKGQKRFFSIKESVMVTGPLTLVPKWYHYLEMLGKYETIIAYGLNVKTKATLDKRQPDRQTNRHDKTICLRSIDERE